MAAATLSSSWSDSSTQLEYNLSEGINLFPPNPISMSLILPLGGEDASSGGSSSEEEIFHNQIVNSTMLASPLTQEENTRHPSQWTVLIIAALFIFTIIVKTLPTYILYLIYGPAPKWNHEEDDLMLKHRASLRRKKLEQIQGALVNSKPTTINSSNFTSNLSYNNNETTKTQWNQNNQNQITININDDKESQNNNPTIKSSSFHCSSCNGLSPTIAEMGSCVCTRL